MKKLLKVIPILVAALVLSACSSSSDDNASSQAASCEPGNLATVESGVLTIATGEPAYYPWVIDDKPESGEGFEAAVAYAVAQELGYDQAAVKWVRTSFDAAIAPGPKTFDFNLQQYSITDERKQVVDFSSAYYKSNQAIVSFKGSKIDGVTTLQGLKDAGAKLGAAVSTTSLDVIESQLGLKASVFNDNAAGVTALKNKQIDGLVVDLPTAFYLSAVEVPKGIIVGQIDGSDAGDQGFGLLLSKDNPNTSCVTKAVDAIRDNGTLQAIIDKWLTASAGAPVLK
ncbi:MAG: amino acid ABC transporter substrate-binding protein [Actinobacteria bacterium]|jgi:polar amino acid transport system substrate-binding protein|nr:amino acid ABC transporter substrate-binding protein [Actinomycetota bacterium]NCU89444.1 amino acid ABC transporter substrate-binding protein [Actinomycetota bacterium]